jgi:hypothetical protein
VATKFGRLFQKELKHYVLFRRKIERELKCAIRLFKIPKDISPLEVHLITSADLMLEINQVVTDCFKRGLVSSGLHQLRLAQEVAHKMFAMHLKPSLAKKKKVLPREVREILEQAGYPDWKDIYKYLSNISHQNRGFLINQYPYYRRGSKVTEDHEISLECWLMVLNIFNMKALYVICKRLKPHMGSDYQHLVAAYWRLEQIANADWDATNKKGRLLHQAR